MPLLRAPGVAGRTALLALTLALLPPRFAGAGPAADGAGFEEYRPAIERIVAAAGSIGAYGNLARLCDEFGPRLSGSAELDQAVEWAVDRLKADGFTGVRAESVMVPVWVRGEESAEIVAPFRRSLGILGLGRSVATPPGGIEGEVAAVGSFAGLDSLGEAGVRDRIVLFDVPFTTYEETVDYRVHGASRAAALGAAAVLVRSVTPASLYTLHTGTLWYDRDQPRIPAAAVTVEDATLIHRLAAAGHPVRVRLRMEAETRPDAYSANVIGEVRGRERPEEIVVVGAHLDSWDVGQGAQDDGVGCVIAMEAAHLLRRLDLVPRRTIRVVLFANEENGLRGGLAYRDRHAGELSRHVAMIESDAGNGPVRGFQLDLRAPGVEEAPGVPGRLAAAREEGLALLRGLAPLLEPVGATRMQAGGSGADVSPSVRLGVPGLGVDHDMTGYFDIHHSPADTFDKIDRATLDRNVAAVAALLYLLAEMPGTLPRGGP